MGVKASNWLRLQLQPEICGSTGSPPRLIPGKTEEAKSRSRELKRGFYGPAWRSEASRKQLRLDSIPPDGNYGMNASKKLELPPARKDELQAPGKKSGSTVKKEKPKHTPPKVKGAELWRDCPAEFLVIDSEHSRRAAKAGRVSAHISIPGPGLLLKEIKQGSFIRKSEGSAISKKIGFASKKLLNNRPKPNRALPKLKGKSR